MPATQTEHTRRRRRRSRSDRRLKARVDALAFFVVLAAVSAVFVYLSRAPRDEPRRVPSAASRPASEADWGDCGIVKTACTEHETPFVAIGVGANKCELRFVCSSASGRQFAAGVCTTVGESGC